MNLSFFNLQPKTRLLIIFLGLLAGLSFLIVLIISTSRQEPQDQAPPPMKQSTPQRGLPDIINNSPDEETRTFLGYQDTVIGKTTDNDISRIPSLVRKESQSGKNIYFFPSTDSRRENIVETRDGKAVFKRVVSITSVSYKTPLIDGYISQYGNPEFEFTGSNRYGQYMKTYVYPSKGFALIFNPYTNEVFEIQSFTPVSLEEYRANWGQDINENLKNQQSDKI